MIVAIGHWVAFTSDPNRFAPFVNQLPIDTYGMPLATMLGRQFGDAILPHDFVGSDFALGLFFLLSGFVIPLSMNSGSQLQFLIRRMFRIYPVVIVTMTVAFLMMFLGRALDGNATLPLSMHAFFANIFLVRDVLMHQYVDNGLWTLEVEMHFYLLCFLLGFINGHRKAWVIAGVSALLCAASYFAGAAALNNTQTGVLLNVIGMNSCFLTLMLFGTALYNRMHGNWNLATTVVVGILLLAANKYCLTTFHQLPNQARILIYTNHVLAAMVFVLLILAGERLPYSRLLDKIANVSYPLYLVHGVSAYVAFLIVFKRTHSVALSMLTAVVQTGVVTYLVHRFVEIPGNRLGKKIADGIVRKPPVLAESPAAV